jgi:hypothetical protein
MKNPLIAGVAAAMAPLMLSGAVQDRTPSCVEASAPNVSLCQEATPGQHHIERLHKLDPVDGGQLPIDTTITPKTGALFFSKPETFVRPQRGSNIVVLSATNTEPPEPPHFEPVREIEPAMPHMIQPIMATYQDEAAYPPFSAVFKSAD